MHIVEPVLAADCKRMPFSSNSSEFSRSGVHKIKKTARLFRKKGMGRVVDVLPAKIPPIEKNRTFSAKELELPRQKLDAVSRRRI